jgi:four helix bundle protein
MGRQLNRAADSVGANIAEAAGRWTKAERRRFLLNARGSLYEAEYWIERAEARSLALPRSIERLDQITHALNGLIRRHSR